MKRFQTGSTTRFDIVEDKYDFCVNCQFYWQIPSFFEASNILVRIPGSSGNSPSLLVSSHFDSVPGSYGATDAGSGIAIMLELVRVMSSGKQPIYTTIFNFNNAEEDGLLGSQAFVNHDWFKDVAAFVNTEGAGAGGREILFRASSTELASIYASVAPYPHGNSLGGDLVNAGLIASTTDYATYTRMGKPGIDLAFYERRAVYHTNRDTIDRISAGSLQQGGSNMLAFVRAMVNKTDSYLIQNRTTSSTPDANEIPVDGDIYGRLMIVISKFQFRLVSMVIVLVAVLVFILRIAYLQLIKQGFKFSLTTVGYRNFIAPTLRAFIVLMSSAVFYTLASIGLCFLVNEYNPIIIRGYFKLI